MTPETLRSLSLPSAMRIAAPGLLGATEMAAIAAARLCGRADPERVRNDAAAAMLEGLELLSVGGRIVLGPRGDTVVPLGARVGPQPTAHLELGVYPVEGASLVARGLPHAISVLVAFAAGSLPALPALWYMEKIVAGPAARGAIDLDDSLGDNLRRIAFARNVQVSDLVVTVLDRPRHQELVAEVRSTGARLLILEEGEILAAVLAAADGTGVDAMVGIGGLPETLIGAALVRCLGGELQARLWPRNDEERLLAGDAIERAYGVGDLAPEQIAAAITGISGGRLLDPVWFGSSWVETSSLVLATQPPIIRSLSSRHLRMGESG